jgi:hypothetical protein
LGKVDCELCGAKVNRQHIPNHQKMDRCKNGRKTYVPPPPVIMERIAAAQAEPPEHGVSMYIMSIPRGHTGEVVCLVDGCFAFMLQKKRCSLWKHFRLQHLEDTIIIEEEGLLPRYNRCSFFSKTASALKHQGTAECGKFAEKRNRHFQQKRQKLANGANIDKVSEFQYLGRILEETDDDERAANRQLIRARARWGRIVACENPNYRWRKPEGNGIFVQGNHSKCTSVRFRIVDINR